MGGHIPEHCDVIGYADDTLILAKADTVKEAMRRVTICSNLVVERILYLGLELAVNKIEAIIFGGRRIHRDLPLLDQNMPIGVTLKYLGVLLELKL